MASTSNPRALVKVKPKFSQIDIMTTLEIDRSELAVINAAVSKRMEERGILVTNSRSGPVKKATADVAKWAARKFGKQSLTGGRGDPSQRPLIDQAWKSLILDQREAARERGVRNGSYERVKRKKPLENATQPNLDQQLPPVIPSDVDESNASLSGSLDHLPRRSSRLGQSTIGTDVTFYSLSDEQQGIESVDPSLSDTPSESNSRTLDEDSGSPFNDLSVKPKIGLAVPRHPMQSKPTRSIGRLPSALQSNGMEKFPSKIVKVPNQLSNPEQQPSEQSSKDDVTSVKPDPSLIDFSDQKSGSSLPRSVGRHTVDVLPCSHSTQVIQQANERLLRDFRITIVSELDTSSAFLTLVEIVPTEARNDEYLFDFARLSLLHSILQIQIPGELTGKSLIFRGQKTLIIKDDVLSRYVIKEAYYGGHGRLELVLGY